ncbi:translation Initiation factor eIF- 4e, partial [Kipferlia bialata]
IWLPLDIETIDMPEHNLHTAWTLWFDEKLPKSEACHYTEHLEKIATVSTLEQLIQLYASLKRPSALTNDITLHVMRSYKKEGETEEGEEYNHVIPAWEEMDKDGGIWIMRLARPKQRKAKKGKKNAEPLLPEPEAAKPKEEVKETKPNKNEIGTDKKWESVLLAVCSERMMEPKLVGVSLSVRADSFSFTLWHKEGLTSQERERIEAKFRSTLGLKAPMRLEHKDCSAALRAAKVHRQ